MGGTVVHEGAVSAGAGDATPSGSRRDLQIETVVGMLQVDLGDGVSIETLEERVRVAFAAFNDAPIRDFVPILVRTSVRRELRGHLPAPTEPAATTEALTAPRSAAVDAHAGHRLGLGRRLRSPRRA
jgi:hypothetical protein